MGGSGCGAHLAGGARIPADSVQIGGEGARAFVNGLHRERQGDERPGVRESRNRRKGELGGAGAQLLLPAEVSSGSSLSRWKAREVRENGLFKANWGFCVIKYKAGGFLL